MTIPNEYGNCRNYPYLIHMTERQIDIYSIGNILKFTIGEFCTSIRELSN